MKRTTNINIPLAILIGDVHLRETQPLCRIDDFWEAQWKELDFIAGLQKKYNCPVVCAGDLFHHWKPSPYLLAKTIQHLPAQFYTVYGNHDLPQHNLENKNKSGIYTLQVAGALTVLDEGHWGQDIQTPTLILQGYRVGVWHIMTWKGQIPYPGCPDPDASRILKKYSNYDLLVTGHNHDFFTVEINNRYLINPGSINKQEAGQIDFNPRIVLWYGDSYAEIPIPGDVNSVTREHIQGKQKRDDRINAFIDHLNQDYEIGVSFEKNLERFFQTNSIRDSVKQVIYDAL